MPKLRMFYGLPLYCALSGFVKAKTNSSFIIGVTWGLKGVAPVLLVTIW
jgi:hypothetical protein